MLLRREYSGPDAAGDRAGISALLARLGFTDHAVERFGERAGLHTARRPVLEPIARTVLAAEGRVVRDRPRWARSRNHADLYIQLGEWMLFVACHDRHQSGRYSVVTVVNGPAENTWPEAVRRGYVGVRPPSVVERGPRRVHVLASIGRAVRCRDRADGVPGLVSAIRRAHAEQRAEAQSEYEATLLSWVAAGR